MAKRRLELSERILQLLDTPKTAQQLFIDLQMQHKIENIDRALQKLYSRDDARHELKEGKRIWYRTPRGKETVELLKQ